MNAAGGLPTLTTEIYKRSIGGTETSVVSNVSTPTPIDYVSTTIPTLHLYSIAVPQTSLLPTDRIVIKLYAKMTSGGTKEVTLYFNDNTIGQVITTFRIPGATGPTGPTGATGPTGPVSSGSNIAGTYYSLVTQPISGTVGTGTVFSYGPTGNYSVGGISLDGGTTGTQLIVPKTGVYETWYSLQLHSRVSQDIYTHIWLRKNGIDVPDTSGRVETKSNTSDSLPIVPYILPLNAGDYIEFVSQTSGATGDIEALSVTGTVGGNIPSIIVGIKQIAVDIGTTGPTGPTGPISLTGPTGAVFFHDGSQVTGTSNFTYTPGGTGILIDGSIVPNADNAYSLGKTGSRWSELYVATGSIYIGPTKLSSTNSDSLQVSGGLRGAHVDVTNGGTGGWQIRPSIDNSDLIIQAVTQTGPTGSTYSIKNPLHPVNFLGSSTGPALGVTGPTGAAMVGSTTLTTHATGYVWAIASLGFQNATNQEHVVSTYLKIHTNQGNTSVITVPKQTTTDGRGNVTLHHLAGPFAPVNSMSIEVYAWDGPTGSISLTHCDIMAMNNLTLSP